jgi:dipeptidyl aminopeptidase/acylaminoacyl peptidase
VNGLSFSGWSVDKVGATNRSGRRAIRSAGVAGLVILVIGAAAIAARGAHNGAKSLLPSRHPIPTEAREEAHRAVPDLQDIVLRTSDGLRLPGWFSPGDRRAVVVFVHGGGGDRRQLFPEAKLLARHGYGFLTYDSRAEGEGEGDMVSWGDRERRDLVAALDFASGRPEIDPQRIVVLGFSIGASTTTLVAAKEPRVRAVILYACWTSLEDETKRNLGKYGVLSWGPALLAFRHAGVDVDAVRPVDHVREIAPRPLMLLAGTDDYDTPVWVMRRMFEAAGEPKRLWIVPGASHGTYFATSPAEYESRVIAFLNEALSR